MAANDKHSKPTQGLRQPARWLSPEGQDFPAQPEDSPTEDGTDNADKSNSSIKRNRVKNTLFLVILILIILSPLLFWSPFRIDHLYRRYFGLPEGVCIGNLEIGGKFPEEVRHILLNEAEKLVIWPQIASIDRYGLITPEVPGRILDVEATMAKVTAAREYEVITPVILTLLPRLTAAEILQINKTLGCFQTFIGGTEDRRENIRLAGSFVNYTLLMPKQVFSFNKTVGPPTPERGFREAPVIIKEELVPGFGGGICQVSSTLYNAVLKAGLKVLERYSHSKQVTYVPPGQDATVAYDYLDFKFLNNRSDPIMVRVWVRGWRLDVAIFGSNL